MHSNLTLRRWEEFDIDEKRQIARARGVRVADLEHSLQLSEALLTSSNESLAQRSTVTRGTAARTPDLVLLEGTSGAAPRRGGLASGSSSRADRGAATAAEEADDIIQTAEAEVTRAGPSIVAESQVGEGVDAAARASVVREVGVTQYLDFDYHGVRGFDIHNVDEDGDMADDNDADELRAVAGKQHSQKPASASPSKAKPKSESGGGEGIAGRGPGAKKCPEAAADVGEEGAEDAGAESVCLLGRLPSEVVGQLLRGLDGDSLG